MSLQAVAEYVKSDNQARQADMEVRWRELVIAVVDGPAENSRLGEPPIIAIILNDLGKTLGQLEEAAQVYAERKRLASLITSGEGMQPKIAAQLDRIHAKRLELEEAAEIGRQAYRRLEAELCELQMRQRDAVNAKRGLLLNVSPATKERHQVLTSRIEWLAGGFQDLMHAEERARATHSEYLREQQRIGPNCTNETVNALVSRSAESLKQAELALQLKRNESKALQAERSELLAGEVLFPTNF